MDLVRQEELKNVRPGAELSPASNSVVSQAGIVVSSVNSTTTALGASATFTGTGENILSYSQVNIAIYATPSTAKASFYFEFSPDGTNWDVSVPSLVRDPTFVIPIPVINVGKFFRVRYLNDGGVSAIAALGLTDIAGTPTAQTNLRLTSYLLPASTKELSRTLDQTIQGSDVAELTRAVGGGKDPSGNFDVARASGLSISNTTTTALGSNATYTGTFEDISGYASIGLFLATNQISAVDGVVFQFSRDGTTVGASVPRSFAAADVTAGFTFFSFPVVEQYLRIVYTNGATAQTTFVLSVTLNTVSQEVVRNTLEASITASNTAQMARAVPFAANASGTYANVTRGANGGLRMSADSLRTIKSTQQSVTTTPAQVTASPLALRKAIALKNIGSNQNDVIYIGATSAVSSGNGYLLGQYHEITIDADTASTIYAVAGTGTVSMCIMEAAE